MRLAVLIILILSGGVNASEQKNITVVYTSSLSGYLDYCTCESAPKGGLVKRGTAIAQLRRENPDLFLVDTGDILPTYIDDTLPPYLVKSYAYLRYDALAFGDQDLDFGIARLLPLAKQIPFISGNIILKKQAQPFPLYRIIRKGATSLAFISAHDPGSFRFSLTSTKENITITDPIEHIKKVMKLKPVRDADAVVILAHAGRNITTAIDESINGAAIIVGGHDQSFTENPVQGKHSIIVHAGGFGARIGVIDVSLFEKRAAIISHRFIHPDSTQPEDDPYIRSLIDAYEKEKGM